MPFRPKTSPYGYDPTLAANVTFLVVFAISAAVHLFQMITFKKWVFGSLLAFGALLEAAGYSARVASSIDDLNNDAFLVQIVLLIIAPCFFSAAMFFFLGSLVKIFGRKYSPLSARMYAIIFITCDIISLVIQAIGGGMAATAEQQQTSTVNGTHIMVAGIDFQLASITAFVILTVWFGVRVIKAGIKIPTRVKIMAGGLALSLICLYIRAIYRTIELAQGWTGVLITTQIYFYTLDGVMMVICVGTFNILHPGYLLNEDKLNDVPVNNVVPKAEEDNTGLETNVDI